MIKVMAIKCSKCHELVYSRARHDYNFCSCGSVGIDGGRSYTKVSFTDKVPDMHEVTLNYTNQDLYNDWNNNINKLGKLGGIKNE